jgi:hypothetical protein
LERDPTSDQVLDYTRKRGVEHSKIVLSAVAAGGKSGGTWTLAWCKTALSAKAVKDPSRC